MDASSAVSSAQSEFIVRICASVSLAILYYDYALTIVAEVERFWMRRWSLVSLIFFLNRYLSLLGHIPVAYELFGVYDASVCNILHLYQQALIAAIQIIIGVLQLFRTYALYNRNRRMLFFLFAYGLVAASIAIWVVTKAFGISKADPQDAVSTSGCEGFLLEAEGRFLAGAWSISLAFDAVIFMLTLYKTLDAVFRSATRSSLSTLLLRDGAFYFGILLLCNVANIVTLVLTQLSPSLRGISVNRTTTISTSLMSRLMLNIRDPAMREPHLSEPPSAATTWVFATVALDTFATETGSSSLATYSEAPSHTGGCETDPSVPRGLENNGQS